MKWFNNPETLEDLKKQYKKLAFQNHPDRGGKTSDMQEINAEYEALFSRLKDTHKNAEGEFYTARTATTETATEFMDIIEKLIHMEGIEIEVCGSWVWVTGDTRPHSALRSSIKEKIMKFLICMPTGKDGIQDDAVIRNALLTAVNRITLMDEKSGEFEAGDGNQNMVTFEVSE